MLVTRVYPASVNNGVELKTKKRVKPHTIMGYEEYPQDFNLTYVITANEMFIVDETFEEFDKRLSIEGLISNDYDGGV